MFINVIDALDITDGNWIVETHSDVNVFTLGYIFKYMSPSEII